MVSSPESEQRLLLVEMVGNEWVHSAHAFLDEGHLTRSTHAMGTDKWGQIPGLCEGKAEEKLKCTHSARELGPITIQCYTT